MKWNKTILYLYPNMQDCFSRSYYRWFFLKSCKCSCFQREVSHTGSSRTAGAQIGEKRFALFDCVTHLWCFVHLLLIENSEKKLSHWLNYHCFGLNLIIIFLVKDPTLFPPLLIERTIHKSLLSVVGLLLGLPRGRSLWFEHHVYLSRCQLRIKKLADLPAVLKSIIEQCTSILKFQMW